MRPVMLVALAVSLLGAEESWTVPAAGMPLVIEAQGFVTLPPRREDQLETPANDLLVRDVVPDGSRVVRGQRVVTFETTRLLNELPVRLLDLGIAEAEGRRRILDAEARLQDLESRRTSAQADLAAAQAALVALGRARDSQIALAEARAAQAALAEAAAARKATIAALGAEVGDQPQDAARTARHQEVLAGIDRRIALLGAQAVTGGAMDTERRTAAERRIALVRRTLGLRVDAEGREVVDPGAGLERQITWARDAVTSARRAANEDIRRRRLSLQEARRSSADHVPLAWMTATPAEGGESRRLDVLGAGDTAVAPGWQAEDGSVFDPRRGWGWQFAPGDANLRQNGTSTSGNDEQDTVRVLDAPAVFLWQLPPGQWTIRLGLGAAEDWDGALVAMDGVGIVHVSNRILGGAPLEVTATVSVAGAPITVRFLDEPGRGLRATRDGLLRLAPDLRRGGKAGWVGRQIAWIVDPADQRIAARVLAGVASLFSTGAASDAPLAACAVREVSVYGPGSPIPVPARVTAVGQRPVSLNVSAQGWDTVEAISEAEGIAREVELTPVAGSPLLPRQEVRVRATITLPPPLVAVPPHLVGQSGTVATVLTRLGRRTVEGINLGSMVVVTSGLAPGDVLYPIDDGGPEALAETAATEVASGEVLVGRIAAGRRVLVPAPATWGRVKDLIDDGTDVQAGQRLLSLYSPWLEGRTRQRAEAKQKMIENAEREARDRASRAEAAAATRRDERDAERQARLDLLQAEDPPDDETRLTAPVRRERADRVLSRAEERREGLSSLGGTEADQAAEDAAQAQIAATRSRLAEAGAVVGPWATIAEVRGRWQAALSALSLRPGKEALEQARNRSSLLRTLSSRRSGEWELTMVAEFERLRHVAAPVGGRLQWLTAWDAGANRMSRMSRDLEVWGGMPLAEIIDLSALDLVVEVPEDRYRRLAVGGRLTVELPDRGGQRLGATITEIGGVLVPPTSRTTVGLAADLRVVTVRGRLDPVSGEQLTPGLRALVTIVSSAP